MLTTHETLLLHLENRGGVLPYAALERAFGARLNADTLYGHLCYLRSRGYLSFGGRQGDVTLLVTMTTAVVRKPLASVYDREGAGQ